MANEYHDERGKFCSRERMASRIDELIVAGKADAAMGLQENLRAIDREVEQEKFYAIWDQSLQDDQAALQQRLVDIAGMTDPVALRQRWETLAALHDGYVPDEAAETYALLANPHLPQDLSLGYADELDVYQAEGVLTDAPDRLPAVFVERLLAQHVLDERLPHVEFAAVGHLSEARAVDIALKSEANLHQFFALNGWSYTPGFEERVTQFVETHPVDGDGWSNVLPYLGQHATGLRAQLLVAEWAGSNDGVRHGLASNRALQAPAARRLVETADRTDLGGYVHFRQVLADNPGLPAALRQIFADDAVSPLPDEVTVLDLERVESTLQMYTVAKEEARDILYKTERSLDKFNNANNMEEHHRVAYLNALAAVDAHEQNFVLLQAGKSEKRKGLLGGRAGVPARLTTHVFLPHRLANAQGYLLHQKDMRQMFFAV